MSKRIDWFRVSVILALAAMFIYLMLLLGRSPIGWMIPTANAQTTPARVALPSMLEGMDKVTWVMPLDQAHPLCWSNGNAGTNLAIRFYRYRVEGGPKQLYLTLPFDLWVAQPVAGNYCTSGTHKVPKAGHWVYEAEICWTPIASDSGNCSVRVSAACPAGTDGCAGAVGSTPRGWWVYAYLPAPSGPVVN